MSCHPTEHKFAGINYLINGITTYPLTKHNFDIEKHNINHLLKTNGYHYLDATKLIQSKQLRTKNQNSKDIITDTITSHKKWAVFTCIGRDTKFITKLFKEFNINTTFQTKNTIGKLLTKNNLSKINMMKVEYMN
jgi:hypothetical protein